MDVKTRRPELDGLEVVINAAMRLHGERHAPELPIPLSAITRYAERHAMSSQFVTLVQVYDDALLAGARKKTDEELKAAQKKSKVKKRR